MDHATNDHKNDGRDGKNDVGSRVLLRDVKKVVFYHIESSKNEKFRFAFNIPES